MSAEVKQYVEGMVPGGMAEKALRDFGGGIVITQQDGLKTSEEMYQELIREYGLTPAEAEGYIQTGMP